MSRQTTSRNSKPKHTASTIQWVSQPPAQKRKSYERRGRMVQFVSLLKTKPNTWAIYDKKYKNQTIVSIARKKFPNTEWTSRANKDGSTYTIYGRYIGK